MFCPKCGKEIPDNATFCPYCGTKVGTQEGNDTTNDTSYSNPQPIYIQPGVQPASDSSSTYHVISILALVFSILGGWLGLVFSIIGLINDKKKDDRTLCWVGLGIWLVWVILYIVWIIWVIQNGTTYYYYG